MIGSIVRELAEAELQKIGLLSNSQYLSVDSFAEINPGLSSVGTVSLTKEISIFYKFISGDPGTRLQTEELGLAELRKSACLRVPRVYCRFKIPNGGEILLSEHIPTGKRDRRFEEIAGHQLALLHQTATAETFGWLMDNWIGATPQPNTTSHDWREFFRKNRLEFQIKRALEVGRITPQEFSLLQNAITRMVTLLPEKCLPVLIHGDLWSGNLLTDSKGLPVFIDPACYFAHHEAEFGMTTLFGNFGDRFLHAYQEIQPLESGWEERVRVYKLYHLLNHLNLFGRTYWNAVEEEIRRFC